MMMIHEAEALPTEEEAGTTTQKRLSSKAG
jgi:hypothetical protein